MAIVTLTPRRFMWHSMTQTAYWCMKSVTLWLHWGMKKSGVNE